MGILFVILFSFQSFAENLNVLDFEVRIPDKAPSCTLLKHRALERQKVIRELDHLQHNEILQLNQLLTNKLFIDKKIWQDASVPVWFSVEVPDSIAATIESKGFDNMVFSLKGAGLNWTSYSWQTPTGYELEYDPTQKIIYGHYLIYHVELCLGDELNLEFKWIPGERIP